MNDLNEAVIHLAICRWDEKAIADSLQSIEAEIAASGLGQRRRITQEALSAVKESVAAADQEVRQSALATYDAKGNKAPHPAAKIKVYTVLDYEPSEALDYARQHLPKALKLNKRVFDKAARAIEPDFVTIAQEARVAIARDLSEYIEEAD